MRENLFMYNQDGTENPLFSMLFAMFSKFAENERSAIKNAFRAVIRTSDQKAARLVVNLEVRKLSSNWNRNIRMF